MSLTTTTAIQAPSRGPDSGRTNVLHLCNGLDPLRDGGMVPSILGFLGALDPATSGVRVATPTPSRLDLIHIPDHVQMAGPVRQFRDHIRTSDVVHVHGLWQYHGRAGLRLARRYRVPYVMTAHGMADPWALRHKAVKKRIYTGLVEGKNLRHAACLHALARPEIDHYRRLAPGVPVALIPNGIDVTHFEDLPGRDAFDRRHPELRGRFLLLFFGRLHEKKGLDLLAAALAALGARRRDVHVLLAGGDEGAGGPFLASMRCANLEDHVTVLGHVRGDDARSLWGAADAFVLPSRSEGFSMAVLEALAARRPALVTTACNFPELHEARGAIVVEPDVEGVSHGLQHLLSMSRCELAAMALRGRGLVEQHYTWAEQGRRLGRLYRWIANGGSAPEFVNS